MARPHRQRANPPHHLLVGRQRLTADGSLADAATVREPATRTSLTTLGQRWCRRVAAPAASSAAASTRGDVLGAIPRDRRPSPVHGGRRNSEVPAAYSSGRVSLIPALPEARSRG